MAELVGLLTSVAVLEAGLTESGDRVVATWLGAACLHFVFRYKSIQSIQIPVVNCKRAVVLARAAVHQGRVLSLQEVCVAEPIVLPLALGLAPQIHLGCPLSAALAAAEAAAGPGGAAATLEELQSGGQRCFVALGAGGAAYVALAAEADADDILCAVWQAVRLQRGGLTQAQSFALAASDGRAFVAAVRAEGLSPSMLEKELRGKPRYTLSVDAAG